MNHEMSVYDLGEIATGVERERSDRPRADVLSGFEPPSLVKPQRRTRAGIPVPESLERRPLSADWRGSLSLFVPGAGHFARGEHEKGLCFLALSGLVVSLAWAVVVTLGSLGSTLDLLGLPSEGAIWFLGTLFAAGAAIHLGGLLCAIPHRSRSEHVRHLHPALTGVASSILPGWGQALNGDRFLAVVFAAGLWLVLAAWLLVSNPVQAVLSAHGLFLPPALAWLASPVARWTLPAVIWAVSVYDAVARARRRV